MTTLRTTSSRLALGALAALALSGASFAPAAGQATAHMEVDFKGAPSEISFNPDYIIDGLKNCELDTVRLEFNERTSPGKFTLGENYIYIVMPITIDT